MAHAEFTNPSQELDVIGSVNITGVLTATSYGNINSSGIVTASEFAGDGSALTGVIGIGSGFVVQDSGSAVGTAATVNFADNLISSVLNWYRNSCWFCWNREY